METSRIVDPEEPTVADSAQRVLLVDDSPVVRCFVAAHLRRAGYAVLEAVDGAEALEAFQREPVHVVITDVGMPRLGGLELLAALREQKAMPEVILLTGSHATNAQAAVQALRLGAHDFIAKDGAAGEALVLAVARASEKWRLRDENARLMRELKALSLTDALTTLGNRRAFDMALRQEVARAQRSGEKLSLVLIDIDHFKRVNDTFGHPAGDEVLASIAQRLLAVARGSDRVFRYGGEEFGVLLGDTDEAGAAALAQRALDSVANRPMTAGRRSLRLTFSAGVAELASSDVSPDALLRRADSALYDAKHQGRNRVVVAPRPPIGRKRESICKRVGETVEGTC